MSNPTVHRLVDAMWKNGQRRPRLKRRLYRSAVL